MMPKYLRSWGSFKIDKKPSLEETYIVNMGDDDRLEKPKLVSLWQ